MEHKSDGDTNCNWHTEIRGRVETIQTIALLILSRILRRVLETCCHSDFSKNPEANADLKNSQTNKKKMNISQDPEKETERTGNQ